MNTKTAIISILALVALSVTAILAFSNGLSGAAVANDYITCCCHVPQGGDITKYKLQLNAANFANDCNTACEKVYIYSPLVFGKPGRC